MTSSEEYKRTSKLDGPRVDIAQLQIEIMDCALDSLRKRSVSDAPVEVIQDAVHLLGNLKNYQATQEKRIHVNVEHSDEAQRLEHRLLQYSLREPYKSLREQEEREHPNIIANIEAFADRQRQVWNVVFDGLEAAENTAKPSELTRLVTALAHHTNSLDLFGQIGFGNLATRVLNADPAADNATKYQVGKTIAAKTSPESTPQKIGLELMRPALTEFAATAPVKIFSNNLASLAVHNRSLVPFVEGERKECRFRHLLLANLGESPTAARLLTKLGLTPNLNSIAHQGEQLRARLPRGTATPKIDFGPQSSQHP